MTVIFHEKIEYKKPLKEITNIENWNYEYKFSKPIKFSNVLSHTYTYGTEYSDGFIKWFRFSIKDKDDKELFKKMQENPYIIRTFDKNGLIASNKLRQLQASWNDFITKYK